MIDFWPASEPAQLDYERLRDLAVAGVLQVGHTLEAERFRCGGLAALIHKPSSMVALVAFLSPVARPRWSPYEDPRLTALAEAYELLRSAESVDAAFEDTR